MEDFRKDEGTELDGTIYEDTQESDHDIIVKLL